MTIPTIIGTCCVVAAVAYWLGARVERHIAAIDQARRSDSRFARAHRVEMDPVPPRADTYAGRGEWADEPRGRVLAYRRGRP